MSFKMALAITLTALMSSPGSACPNTVLNHAGIKAVSLDWKKAFNARDSAAVSALYADDAVLSAPDLPVVTGKAAITKYFIATVAAFSKADVTVTDAPMGNEGVSGNLGYLWETYQIVANSGTMIDTGRLLTLYRCDGGKWLIIADTWNSDGRRGEKVDQGK